MHLEMFLLRLLRRLRTTRKKLTHNVSLSSISCFYMTRLEGDDLEADQDTVIV
jgi:hypothetical protein